MGRRKGGREVGRQGGREGGRKEGKKEAREESTQLLRQNDEVWGQGLDQEADCPGILNGTE